MKKLVISLCLALPVLISFAGCNTSETPTAPNGGKKVDTVDVAPPPVDNASGVKVKAAPGMIKSAD